VTRPLERRWLNSMMSRVPRPGQHLAVADRPVCAAARPRPVARTNAPHSTTARRKATSPPQVALREAHVSHMTGGQYQPPPVAGQMAASRPTGGRGERPIGLLRSGQTESRRTWPHAPSDGRRGSTTVVHRPSRRTAGRSGAGFNGGELLSPRVAGCVPRTISSARPGRLGAPASPGWRCTPPAASSPATPQVSDGNLGLPRVEVVGRNAPASALPRSLVAVPGCETIAEIPNSPSPRRGKRPCGLSDAMESTGATSRRHRRGSGA
jgi:hypothetical protein